MAKLESQLGKELAKFVEAAWLDLPAAAATRLVGSGTDEALSEAGWKAYDAWVRVANEAMNGLYSNPRVGRFTGRAMETALRVHHVGSAVASAIFGNLWPAVGLPTSTEIQALRDEVIELRQELSARARGAAARQESEHLAADDGIRLIWNGAGHAGNRARTEGKSSAAA